MNQSGYTGHLFEREVLGTCLVKWDGTTHLSFSQSMELVRNNQPSDPSDPEPRTINDLHAHIAVSLGLDDWSALKFYTAVGSLLDVKHGVDGFFEFAGRVVTLDLTINPHKDEWKADMIIHPADLDDLPLLAKDIAHRLSAEAA